MKTMLIKILAAGTILAACANLHATVIVSESFDYGGIDITLANDTSTLDGGIGLSGSWSLRVTSPNNEGTYTATGLTFGNLDVSGGAMRTSADFLGSSSIDRALGVTHTGDLWGRFLYSGGTPVTGARQSELLLTDSSDPLSSEWGSDAAVSPYSVDDLTRIKVGDDQTLNLTAVNGTAMTFSDSNPETYLVLFKITNVGGLGNKNMDLWTLTESQFAHFKPSASDSIL